MVQDDIIEVNWYVFDTMHFDNFLFWVHLPLCGSCSVPIGRSRVLEHLGFPVAIKKTEHCITFLDIVIDIRIFELSLPAEKKIQHSLLDHLSDAATVVNTGRIFLCHCLVCYI